MAGDKTGHELAWIVGMIGAHDPIHNFPGSCGFILDPARCLMIDDFRRHAAW